ncbi:MAG: DUF4129 domain-containing protein [Chloroflexi bacterium]|nr:DUF4129 domain-containing protein [Chloroflexota bacterium]
MTKPSSLARLNLRAELRLALLAATEACWIYAAVLTVGTAAGFPRQVSPVGIFLVYWIALSVGRLLPGSHQAWRLLQVITVLIALVAVLAAIRIGLYTDLPLTDVAWLPAYFARALAFFDQSTAEQFSTLALIFAFLRGLSLAQRPLTLWAVGFGFRLGIVAFFGIALFAAFTVRVDFIFWIFVYFALSLLAIALARIEDEGQEYPLGPKWAGVLLAAIATTMLLGFFASQFLTLETIGALFALLAPLGSVVRFILTLIAVPLFYLLDILGGLLAPLFDLLRSALANLKPLAPGDNPAMLDILNRVTRGVEDLYPYLRLLGVMLVIGVIGWVIARALNKRVKWAEKEMFAREQLDEDDGFAPEPRPRARAPRFARHEIHAENVRRIYAALLAQAAALGLPRRDAETPFEFLPRLVARFPDSTAALQTITDAYVAVHYAQQPATDAQVRELRAIWQHTRAEMREKSSNQ